MVTSLSPDKSELAKNEYMFASACTRQVLNQQLFTFTPRSFLIFLRYF